MSTIESNNDLSFDDDPDGPDDHRIGMTRANIRALEAAAKKGKDADAAVARAEAAERALVFSQAGVDVTTPEGGLFMRGYDGELDKDAVKTAAIPFGLVQAEEPFAPTGKGHVLNDDTAGDTPLLEGEDTMTGQRTTVASGAPPDLGVEVNPHDHAVDMGQQIISQGGSIADGFAAGFHYLAERASQGDQRVIVPGRSVAGRGE